MWLVGSGVIFLVVFMRAIKRSPFGRTLSTFDLIMLLILIFPTFEKKQKSTRNTLHEKQEKICLPTVQDQRETSEKSLSLKQRCI